jgi:hypothetical protein
MLQNSTMQTTMLAHQNEMVPKHVSSLLERQDHACKGSYGKESIIQPKQNTTACGCEESEFLQA